MERLNEIMTRVAQRRQQEAEQRLSQGHATPAVYRPPTSRYALPEQTARLGQTLPASHASGKGEVSVQAAGPTHPRHLYGSPRAQSNAEGGEKRPFAREGARNAPLNQADAYSPGTQADVQEDWEDDTADMRFGDWENDEAYEQQVPPRLQAQGTGLSGMPHVSRAAARIAQTYGAKGNRPLATRELPLLPGEESDENEINSAAAVERPGQATREFRAGQARQPAPLRNVRDAHDSPGEGKPRHYIASAPPTRIPHDAQRPAQLPAPSSGEARPPHRVTQPLNRPPAVRMSQNIPPEDSRVQKMPPQEPMREQSTQLIPAPYTAPTTVCPLCKGAGYLRADVPYGHPNFGKPIACECKESERKEKRRLQLLELSNLGDLKQKTFENFRPNTSRAAYQAYQVALAYARDPEGWLVLIGRVGCGKTHLAAAIANNYLARGSLVLFSTVSDLLDHLRAAYTPTSPEVYDQLFDKMREAELLVLDDLGAQQSSPWANEKLFQLLNYRYNARFPTIITTNNVGLQGVEERIRSRMMDASLVTIVTFDGAQDYRPRNPRRE